MGSAHCWRQLMRLLWKTKDGRDIIIPRSKCYLLLKANYALSKKRGIRSHRDTWFTGILLALSLELAKCHSVPLEGLASSCWQGKTFILAWATNPSGAQHTLLKIIQNFLSEKIIQNLRHKAASSKHTHTHTLVQQYRKLKLSMYVRFFFFFVQSIAAYSPRVSSF